MKLYRYTTDAAATFENRLIAESQGDTDADIQALRDHADADRRTLPAAEVVSRWTDESFRFRGNTDYVRASLRFEILRTVTHVWYIAT